MRIDYRGRCVCTNVAWLRPFTRRVIARYGWSDWRRVSNLDNWWLVDWHPALHPQAVDDEPLPVRRHATAVAFCLGQYVGFLRRSP